MSESSEKPAEEKRWSTRLKASNFGETLKSWSAILMGLAALITALSTYRPPEDKSKIVYEELRKELKEMSKDISSMSNDVNYLYRLRELEESKRKSVEELQRSNETIEDIYLRRSLAQKYGEKYARDYMERRQKLREEIRKEYAIYPNGGFPKKEVVPPAERELPEHSTLLEKAKE